jgi:hypothetical protein
MKDPAFLFYSSDFLIGTALFTEAETGQYIKILCYMHQHGGKLCPEDLTTLFPSASARVLKKFKRDEHGCYYNDRLLDEMEKRKKFTESRRENLKKYKEKKEKDLKEIKKETKTPHMGAHMKPHMENENEISISSFEKSEKLLSEEPIVPEMAKEFKKIFPKYPVNEVKDFTACYDIAKMIGEEKNLNSVQILSEGREYVLKRWSEIIQFIKTDKWYSTRSLADISKEWQRLIQTINSNVKGNHYNTKPTFTDKVAENNRYFEQFGENGSSGEG